MHSAEEALQMEGVAGAQCHNHHLKKLEPWNTSLGTTGGTMSETIQRTEVLGHQSGSEVLETADTGDECSPPHFVDIFDGKNRPMSRAMDWCGWSTSSFERSPAGCSCAW